MKASGCKLDNYRLNPIVLADHDPCQPIGNFAPEIKDAVEGIITFAPAGISAKADEYCGLYKSGVLNAVTCTVVTGIAFGFVSARPRPRRAPAGARAHHPRLLRQCQRWGRTWSARSAPARRRSVAC